MNQLILEEIAKKYRDDGILMGAEFLLPVDKMLFLIDDLAEQGVSIIGCDLWRYVDREKNWIVQLLGAGFALDDIKMTAKESANLVKEFLTTKLPNDAELTSLLFDDIKMYDFFKH